ncbi:hypothetical protein, partial [Bacillus altitudinis]|uniref:hypothetical protein n=1 Tax=Bacillus altitudinis TaxID=293387 RepID=UPI001C92F762
MIDGIVEGRGMGGGFGRSGVVIRIYVVMMMIIGVRIKGMRRIGLMRMGIGKMMGWLMLKMGGGMGRGRRCLI